MQGGGGCPVVLRAALLPKTKFISGVSGRISRMRAAATPEHLYGKMFIGSCGKVINSASPRVFHRCFPCGAYSMALQLC